MADATPDRRNSSNTTFLSSDEPIIAAIENDPQPAIEGYELLGELGRGGVGVVYRARQRSLDRIVALKVLVAGIYADEELLARFRAEAEAVASLQHANIVQLFEIGTTQGCPYFSLEYVPGGSLADKLRQQLPAPREAALLMREIALAIEAAHAKGLIHRDLKPGNILLTNSGSPKVADFGLAKRLAGDSALTRTGDVMGTPSYMAPEQAGGQVRELGPACDTYALGAILYEMLTGRPPFRGHDSMETLLAVLHEEPVSIRRLSPRTPRDLETICHKCLQKQPNKRYRSAQDLADDLGRYLDGLPIAARPVSLLEKGIKLAQRRPLATTLVSALVVGVLSFLIYGTWKNRQLATALAAKDKALQRSEMNFRAAIDAAGRRITRSGQQTSDPLHEELVFFEKVRQQTGEEEEARYERALGAGWAGYIYAELDDAAKAREALNESVDELARLVKERPRIVEYRRDLAQFMGRRANFLANHGDDAARGEYEKCIAMFETLLVETPNDEDYRRLLSAQCNNLAVLLGKLGEDSLPMHKRAEELRESLVREFPGNIAHQMDLMVTRSNLSANLLRKMKYAEAEQTLRAALDQFQHAPAALQGELQFRRSLATERLNLGYALEKQQQAAAAAEQYAAGVQVLEQIVSELPQSVPLRQMLIDALVNLGKLQLGQMQEPAALPIFRRVLELYGQLNREFPDDKTYAAEVARYSQFVPELQAAVSPGT
jgi:serine/threonine protein kinase